MRKSFLIVISVFSILLTNCSDESGYRTAINDQNSDQILSFEEIDMEAEKNHKPDYIDQATGDLDDHKKQPDKTLYQWPCNLSSIGHTIASYQNYSNSPYFHHGIDIRCDAGADVYASAGGRVINIENYKPGVAAYWEVAILDDEGFIWQYHHIERKSIPQEIHAALKSGEKIEAGTKIGEVFYWSVAAYGERFHHIHLNILGKNKAYVNPLALLEKLPDHSNPNIVEVGIIKNGKKVNTNTVQPPYSIYAKIHDLILHTKFVVPAYHLSYAIDGEEFRTVWQFDSLPGGSSNTKYVNDYFVPSLTCGNYNCRELAVNLGFSPNSNITFPTTQGTHSIEIIAKDFYGNETRHSFDWTVR